MALLSTMTTGMRSTRGLLFHWDITQSQSTKIHQASITAFYFGGNHVMYGYKHRITGEWLDNDFQNPHFPGIDALIAACYPSEDNFVSKHGYPEDWEKTPISEEEIQQIFGGGE